MKRLPKDKISLSIYVSKSTRKKLYNLQGMYFLAGKRFSLSLIVELFINVIYELAYFRMEKPEGESYHEKTILLRLESLFTIIKNKNSAVKEIMRNT